MAKPPTEADLDRAATELAARLGPGFLDGLSVLGQVAVVNGRVLAKSMRRDDVARATLKALELLRPLASTRSKGSLTRGLKTAALAEIEALRTAVAKW